MRARALWSGETWNDYYCLRLLMGYPAYFVIIVTLAAIAAGFFFLLCRAGSDGVTNLKDRCDALTAPLVSAGGETVRSSGCVFGMTGHFFNGDFCRYARDCLLECTPTCLCCVTLIAGEPDRRYIIPLGSITQCKVRKSAKEYRVTFIADGKKSVFSVPKRSPRDIIPQQGERSEKFIETLCKAAGPDSSPA